MSNAINWVLHPDGTDTNGGGYSDEYAGTWSQWHSSFGPVDAITSGAVSTSGGKVRITKAGSFDGAAVGMLVYFSATGYTAGHYVIIAVDASDNYIDINCAYDADQTDAVVNVGGALKELQTAIDLSQQQTATISGGSWSVTDADGGTSTSKRMKLTNAGLFANYHDNTVAYYPHAEDGQVFIDFASGGTDGIFTIYSMDDDSVTINRPYVASTITAVYIRSKPDNIMVCQGTYALYDCVNQYGAVQYDDGNANSFLRPEHIIFGVDPTDGTELGDDDTWPVFQAADKATPCTSAGTISDNGGYVKVTFAAYNPSTASVVAGEWCYVNWSGTGSAPYVDGRFQIRSVASDSVTLELAYSDPAGRTVTALYWGNWDNHGYIGATSCMFAPLQTASSTYYASLILHHIVFDGDNKAPVGMYLARNASNYIYTFLHDVEIKNTKYYGLYSGSYTTPNNEKMSYNFYNLNIHNCVRGMSGNRGGNAYNCKIYSNTEYGLANAPYVTENSLFYDNKYGIYVANSATAGRITKCTFVNNTVADMYFQDGHYSTRYQGFKDCLFYSAVESSKYGDISTFTANSAWYEFIDCCVNIAITLDMFGSSISNITQIGTKVLTESPFVNISGDVSTWDLRLKHAGADYAKLMDQTTGRICGALGFAPVDFPLATKVYDDTVNGVAGSLTLPAAANVWNTSDAYGVGGSSHTPAMHASDIPVTGGAEATLTAADIVEDVVVDDLTGTATSEGGSIDPSVLRPIGHRQRHSAADYGIRLTDLT